MASRWKRVDLLRLSSVAGSTAGSSAGSTTTAGAVARQRQRPAPTASPTTPPFAFRTGPTADFSSTANFARRGASDAQHAPNDGPGAAPLPSTGLDGGGAQTVPRACPSIPRTRVSVSRLLCGTALPWRSALDCFHELAEGESWRRRGPAGGDVEGENESEHASADHAGSSTGAPVMPLEAIVAVYGMLLRQERVLPPRAFEGGSPATGGVAETEMEPDAEAWCTPDAHTSASTAVGFAGSTGSLPAAPSSRAFLARAAARHAALQPLHALLRCGSGRIDAALVPHAPLPAPSPSPPTPSPSPPQASLLSLSTVLHVGLARVLRMPSDAPRASARELWRAVEAIHHLQQYGWGPDYLESLSAAKAAIPAVASSPYGAAPLGALECVRRVAHATPIFTDVFDVLAAAWAARHDVQLGVSGRGQPPAHAFASSWRVGGSAATLKGGHGEEGEASCTAAADRVLELHGPVEQHTQGTPHGAVDDDEAVLRKVQSLAAVPPTPGDVHAAQGDAAADATAVLQVARGLPLHELSAVTRDVVTFAWRAMCIRSPHSPPQTSELECDVPPPPLESDEHDALLRLVRAATRFASFAELQRWLDVLAPCSTTSPTAPALTVFAQQEAALLCLLTRAVRRAPTWAAACEVLERVWPRLPPARLSAGLADVHCIQRGGVAQVPALLEALLSLPHPLGHTGVAAVSDCAFWARVVGGVHPWMSCSVDGHGADSACAAEAQLQQQQRWSQILFADEAPAPPSAHAMAGSSPQPPPPPLSDLLANADRQHEARTRAAVLLVRHRLRPAEALEPALHCLARSHAWCARLWAACLAAASSPTDALVREKPNQPTSQRARMSSAAGLLTTSMAATAAARLADQHRTYCSLLLSSSERLDWLDVSLQCAPHGLARQLVLEAALQTRWRATPSPATSSHAAEASASLACAVTELAALVHRWVTAPPARVRDFGVADPLHGDGSTDSVALIGDVGRLMADAQAVFQPRGAADGAAPVAPDAASATASLLAHVRAAVTHAGLRLERSVHQATCSPAGPRGSHDDAAVDAAPVPAAVDLERRPATMSSSDALVRLAQLRGWAGLLCTAPTELIADEACIVVWLYVLMRQVEELHGVAQANSARQQAARALVSAVQLEGGQTSAPVATSPSASAVCVRHAETVCEAADRIGAWSLEAEEALVRRVAQSLSAQLWPVLPPTSLLPPMLLNWLLTRGGERMWAAAVRTLRGGAAAAAAGDAAAHTAATEEAKSETDAASGRRFSLLALPLDRIVSMQHAVRVLRTLQVVEERCAAAPAHTAASSSVRPRAAEGEVVDHSVLAATAAASSGGIHPLAASTCAVTFGTADLVSNAGADVALADVYAQVERVLLREWYGRALAAVLVFFARHPTHTCLTDIRDAPQHAAVQLHRRHSTSSSQSKPSALRPSADTWHDGVHADNARLVTAKPSLLSQVVLDDVTAREGWRGWTDESTPPSQVGVVETRTGHDGAESGYAEASTRAPAVPPDPPSSPPSTPSRAADVSVPPMRVPLHLLGTFILAECHVGLGDAGSTPPPAAAPLSQQRSARSRRAAPRRAILSPLSALDSLDALLRRPRCPGGACDSANPPTPPHVSSPPSAAMTATRTTEANRRACGPARSVHPELLALYLRLVQRKKRDAPAPAMSVEDAVAEVLKQRCAVEVIVEEEEQEPPDAGAA